MGELAAHTQTTRQAGITLSRRRNLSAERKQFTEMCTKGPARRMHAGM